MLRVLLAAVVAALLVVPSAVAATPGVMEQQSFSNGAGTRTYFVYEPVAGGAGKPVMVWLHGCGGPGTMSAGHALARVAEERGFTVVYPVQPAGANALRCWNWVDAGHQKRGVGEPSILAGITSSVLAEVAGDPARVYVGGYSAGGAMTTVMGATYPDLYAAIAPSAGAPYAIFDASGVQAYRAMGPRARPMPAFIQQGLLDEISLYPLVGRANILQWLGTDDYADDGRANWSVSRLPSNVSLRVVQTTLPLPMVIEHYKRGSCEVGQFLTSPYEHMINGLLFYEDAGLELQRLMMSFLLAHRLGGPGVGCG